MPCPQGRWVHSGCPGKAEVGMKGKVTLSERGVRCSPALLEADGQQGSPSQGPVCLQHRGGRLGAQEWRGQPERGAGAHQPLNSQVSTEPGEAIARRGQAAV